LLTFLKEGFTHAATARVSTSAHEALRLGYLQWHDVIVAHKDELLWVATAQAKALFESGYRPPAKTLFPVAGRSAQATIMAQLVNLRDGGFATAHDFHIGSLMADVLCGGGVEAGSLVDEAYLLALERKHFCALLAHPKTQERVMGILSTGKPVRN
jgi:3-hydroxyacyl-CoA dehydrogenase